MLEEDLEEHDYDKPVTLEPSKVWPSNSIIP